MTLVPLPKPPECFSLGFLDALHPTILTGHSALSSEVGSWYAWWSTAMHTEAVWTE